MSENPSADVNQAIPLAPSDARQVIPGDVKSIDELLKIVNEPYNQPLWPIQKGLGKWPGSKKPSFNLLATYLLSDDVGMKTTLPLPSEEIQAEALKIVAESGPDALKLKSVVSKVSKKKAAATRTTSSQKDMLVAKALEDGTVKPSALAADLREMRIDPAIAGTFQDNVSSMGVLLPPPETSGTLPGTFAQELSTQSTQNLFICSKQPTVEAPSDVEATEQGDLPPNDDLVGLGMNTTNGAPPGESVTSPETDVSEPQDTQMDSDIGTRVFQTNKDIHMDSMDSTHIDGAKLANEWNMNQMDHMNLGCALRIIISDLRFPGISGSEVVELLVPNGNPEDFGDVHWLLDVKVLLSALQSSGSAIHAQKRPFKVQVPSMDEEDCWMVLLNIEAAQSICDASPAIKTLVIKPDTNGINKLKMRLVPVCIPGDTPMSTHKRVRDIQDEDYMIEKRVRGSLDDDEVNLAGERDKTAKPLLVAQEILAERKATVEKDILGFIQADLSTREGWQEFLNFKGKVLTNPQIVKQVAFASQVMQDYTKITKDDKGNRITKDMVATALRYHHSRIADMKTLHNLIKKYGPNGDKSNPEVCECLAYVPEDGEAPEGAIKLKEYLKTLERL
ncbi:hypothetical protein M422DRAFT_268083 [Sphaerobolus stellatus SS14]|uniref:Uncharacterized protein n=1 Tax=Sphaerobolus stellatus (strain SS14) TaxID=990650 RepID=A0A0C9TKY0_SPHS4|nr:hypothetical protein M422DRAFT_268083 [Sphaerobolus stellatus SS14]